MWKNKRVNDPYTNKARKENLVARSYYKLEEIDQKYDFFTHNTNCVIDIWAAPWSRLQYIARKLKNRKATVLWFDLKPIQLSLPNVETYIQDITKHDEVKKIVEDAWIKEGSVDVIVSDMAPDTIWAKDIDALRSVGLIEKTLRMYDQYLAPDGKFAIKVFMWPWFEELLRDLRKKYGHGPIQIFKPKACRKKSKETYILKRK